MSDPELQQYLFDLQGYLVIENALSKEEVATLNELLDQQDIPMTGVRRNFGRAPEGSGFLEWGKPFCDLLDHPKIMPILQFRLGECFRLDRLFGFQLREGTPGGDLHADYGASKTVGGRVKGFSERYLDSEVRPGRYYHVPANEMLNGFVVVSWNLSDTGPDTGGVCCIPGSHKSNYRLPQEIFDAPEKAPCVVIPSAPAGSVILFTEALTHGSTPWKGKHDRRTLLYKYCVSQMSWSSKLVEPPTNVELTPRQRILFRQPADPYRHFPSLFAEG